MYKFTAIKKNTNVSIFLWVFALATPLLFLNTVASAQKQPSNYDQQFVPIQPQVLKRELLHSSKDPVRMYDLIRRADRQGQTSLAYTTLHQMRLKHPNDAVVLASFCFVSQVVEGDYSGPNAKRQGLSAAEVSEYSNALLKAYRLDPKLWLTYAVEGHSLMTSLQSDLKALQLLKTAVRLAPDISYTHTLLGEAYTVYDTPYHSFALAAKEFWTAKNLSPVSAHNADLLFDIYDVRTPNPEMERKAKEYFLSTVPPNYKFTPQFKERLAKY